MPPLHSTQTAHIFTHTAHTQQAWIWGEGDGQCLQEATTWASSTWTQAWWATDTHPGLQGPTLTSHQQLTFTDRGLPCPFHVCFACPVLRSTCKEESWMAGVHQGVAKGGEVYGSHICMGWCFRLAAGVS